MEHFDIQNLTFSHAAAKGKLSLDGVSLRIRAGEFLVLCGRSGSGKTTLLRHLKTVLTPNGKRSGETARRPTRKRTVRLLFLLLHGLFSFSCLDYYQLVRVLNHKTPKSVNQNEDLCRVDFKTGKVVASKTGMADVRLRRALARPLPSAPPRGTPRQSAPPTALRPLRGL